MIWPGSNPGIYRATSTERPSAAPKWLLQCVRASRACPRLRRSKEKWYRIRPSLSSRLLTIHGPTAFDRIRLRVFPISTATNQLQLPGVDIDLPLRLNIPGFWGTVGYGSRHVTIDMRRSDAGSADDFCPPCNPAEQPRHSNFTTNSWSEGRCDMTGPRPAGSPWTQGDDDRLRSLLSSGMKAALIAAKLKRTAGAIRSRANWLRRQAELTSPRSAPTDALKAARMTASAEPAELKARE